MAQMASLIAFNPNTTILSADENSNNTTIRNTYNTHDTAVNGVHGVASGAIVGTTLAQTLTGKTLASPIITTTLNLYSGADLNIYSDAGTTLVADINGATGDLSLKGDLSIDATDKIYFSKDSDTAIYEISNLVMGITFDDGVTNAYQFTPNTFLATSTGAMSLDLRADTNNSGQENLRVLMQADGGSVKGEVGIQSNAGALILSGGTANSTFLASMTADSLELGTNAVKRFGIDSAGNFTFNATADLKANGELKLVDATSPTASYMSRRAVNGAWVMWTNVGGTGNQTIDRAYNVSSVNKTATGTYTITLSTIMASANYCGFFMPSATRAYFLTSALAGSFVINTISLATLAANDAPVGRVGITLPG